MSACKLGIEKYNIFERFAAGQDNSSISNYLYAY